MNYRKKLNYCQEKIIIFFLGKIYFTSNDGSQNVFDCQPTFNVLELKKDKCTENIIG